MPIKKKHPDGEIVPIDMRYGEIVFILDYFLKELPAKSTNPRHNHIVKSLIDKMEKAIK